MKIESDGEIEMKFDRETTRFYVYKGIRHDKTFEQYLPKSMMNRIASFTSIIRATCPLTSIIEVQGVMIQADMFDPIPEPKKRNRKK